MSISIWRFIALVLAALNMGMTWSHVLELPAKMRYDGPQWTTLQQTLYRAFGSEGPGWWIEPGSVLATGLSALQVRGAPPFRLTLAGASLLAAALGTWFIVIAPVNAAFATWTPDTIPSDWTRKRQRWEFGHAARFLLQFAGFAMLVASVLAKTSALSVRTRRATG